MCHSLCGVLHLGQTIASFSIPALSRLLRRHGTPALPHPAPSLARLCTCPLCRDSWAQAAVVGHTQDPTSHFEDRYFVAELNHLSDLQFACLKSWVVLSLPKADLAPNFDLDEDLQVLFTGEITKREAKDAGHLDWKQNTLCLKKWIHFWRSKHNTL